MSDRLEDDIRNADLEAGWQRYAGIRWRGAMPDPGERLRARNDFAAGMAWMFEILMNLGEKPHEFANRVTHVRQQLHFFAVASRASKNN